MRDGGLVRDARRDPSSNDDVAGLEALDYWTHLCDCARRKTDVRLFVSNEYLSFRFGCIIEPTGFIMNKHTYIVYCKHITHACTDVRTCTLVHMHTPTHDLRCVGAPNHDSVMVGRTLFDAGETMADRRLIEINNAWATRPLR